MVACKNKNKKNRYTPWSHLIWLHHRIQRNQLNQKSCLVRINGLRSWWANFWYKVGVPGRKQGSWKSRTAMTSTSCGDLVGVSSWDSQQHRETYHKLCFIIIYGRLWFQFWTQQSRAITSVTVSVTNIKSAIWAFQRHPCCRLEGDDLDFKDVGTD